MRFSSTWIQASPLIRPEPPQTPAPRTPDVEAGAKPAAAARATAAATQAPPVPPSGRSHRPACPAAANAFCSGVCGASQRTKRRTLPLVLSPHQPGWGSSTGLGQPPAAAPVPPAPPACRTYCTKRPSGPLPRPLRACGGPCDRPCGSAVGSPVVVRHTAAEKPLFRTLKSQPTRNTPGHKRASNSSPGVIARALG